MDIDQLVETIKKANRDYYLLGSSDLDDAEYDQLVEQLRELDPTNPILSKVGDDSASEKVVLPHQMGSQTKIRPADQQEIAKIFHDRRVVEMPKLDGLSMQIEYLDGKFVRLMTRGNGYEGQDITERGKYMNFPKNLSNTIKGRYQYVFGEAVISKENFKKVRGEYKHPRNFVGGTLRPILTNREYSKLDEDIKFNCGLIDIVAFDVIGSFTDLDTDSFKEKIDYLEAVQHFNVVDTCIYKGNRLSENHLDAAIKDFKANYKYITDGVVIRIDSCQQYAAMGKDANGLNPKGARAVKADIHEQFSQVAVIKDIEWTISKRGVFVPVVVLQDPVFFDGVEVTKVNGVNRKYVEEGRWGTGTKIKIIRSGDVIPRIIRTIEDSSLQINPVKIPQTCPHCGSVLKSNDAHIYCDNKDCPGKARAQVIDFFVALKLEDVGRETIASLYDHGYNTFGKLIEIQYNDLIGLAGYQAAKSLKTQRQLNNCLQDIELAKLMHISQVFMNEKTSLGMEKLQWVIDSYGEQAILDSLNNVRDSQGNFKKLDPRIIRSIKGFGDVGIQLFTKNYLAFKALYNQLKPYIKIKRSAQISGKLSGMSFCFTQWRDKELEQLIINNGGVVKGISKSTTVLFSAGQSTKTNTAIKYGIPIVQPPQARDYILQLLGRDQ